MGVVPTVHDLAIGIQPEGRIAIQKLSVKKFCSSNGSSSGYASQDAQAPEINDLAHEKVNDTAASCNDFRVLEPGYSDEVPTASLEVIGVCLPLPEKRYGTLLGKVEPCNVTRLQLMPLN